jgi:D-aminoacyl-tRNA deacylase
MSVSSLDPPPPPSAAAVAKAAAATTTATTTASVKTILLLATTEDKASLNLVKALLSRGGWTESPPIDKTSRVWYRPTGSHSIYLWQISQGFLHADWLDQKWLAAYPEHKIQELIFLSRHAAVSGRPSLTIHPIGNPGQPFAADEQVRAAHGGVPGRCVPPSPRMASLFRQLYKAVQDTGLAEAFEVTLEATHHGPWLAHPSMFVEIGSKEEDWGREDGACVWAEVLDQNLGLSASEGSNSSNSSSNSSSSSTRSSTSSKLVVVGVGGGHYTPKMNDLLRHRQDVLLGHVLASYCFNGPAEDWQRGVEEAIRATRAAYEEKEEKEDIKICVYIDKKAFKSAPRQALVKYLETQGISYGFKESELI